MIDPMRMKLHRFLGDRRGVAAIEFALVVPILLAFYFMTMEFSQAIDTSKKTSRIASMVSDLVSQQPTMTPVELEAIMKIGEAVLQPYNRSKPEIIITAVEVTDEDTPKVKVVWSRKLKNGAFSVNAAAGTTTTVPAQLKARDSFFIRTEVRLGYRPVITWSADQKQALGLMAAFKEIKMGETYHLRPRMSRKIPCGDC